MYTDLIIFVAVAGIITGILALALIAGMAAELLGRKCPDCNSRKTFTWTNLTRDMSLPTKIHVSVNCYCFKCCRFVVRNNLANHHEQLNRCLTYKLAARHHRKHREDAAAN